MRRISLWFLSTVAVVTLLFGYHPSTPGPTPTLTQAVAPAAGGSTVTGAVAQTRWGPVQVRLTLADGKITAVDVVQYPDGNGRDREINDDALPVLVQETISAQSADVDMVSGATVTSTGYVQSLQSALDQAGSRDPPGRARDGHADQPRPARTARRRGVRRTRGRDQRHALTFGPPTCAERPHRRCRSSSARPRPPQTRSCR